MIRNVAQFAPTKHIQQTLSVIMISGFDVFDFW